MGEMKAISANNSTLYAYVLQTCLQGIACTQFQQVNPGIEQSVTVVINHKVPEGNYCTNTWLEASGGGDILLGQECVGVHP